jgi:putative acyl-CoA dehydrogenase
MLAGTSMTEKQGGSDVRTNTTRAVRAADGTYRSTWHKWFTSAPMCAVFLVLAQAPGGMSCFLLPRILPDWSCNRMYLQRLKDKLGNRSNASAELEYDDAVAWLVGEEGNGLRLILEMVVNSRSAVTASTGFASAHRPSRRGAGVLGRQRVRRGLGDATPVPGGAAELDLGGLGQRHRARRPASTAPRARIGREIRPSSSERAVWRSTWPSRCRRRCSCATAIPR